jgi:hypothetical protein
MKNVFLYVGLFVLLSMKSFGQDLQNANWYFGNYVHVKFPSSTSSQPIAVSGSTMDTWETAASVSDDSGQTLFYSDSGNIKNRNNQIMTNGDHLNGHGSNTQGVIIVRKPGNNSIYYVVTIDGLASAEGKGLYYSVVDMTMSGGLGAVVQKNIVMKDWNGTNIDRSYYNGSEKLTSTKHSNGKDYWIVTQIQDRICSYLVSSTGIESIPITSLARVNIGPRSNGGACMKISPNGRRIVVGYPQQVNVGDFNSATGQVIFDRYQVPSPLGNVYGVEFSSQSENIFITTLGATDVNHATSFRLYKLRSNGINMELIQERVSLGSLQLAINNKIYASRWEDYNSWNLSVINDPDNYDNPNFQFESVNAGGRVDMGLPQWVHSHDPCPDEIILISPEHNVDAPFIDNREASNSIIASNTINAFSEGVYHAGNTVVLKDGFYSGYWTKFRAYIEGCSGGTLGSLTNVEEQRSAQDYQQEPYVDNSNLFVISPNPAVTSFNVMSTLGLKYITVTSFDGKVMFRTDLKGSSSYTIDIGGYIPGIYTVTVLTDTGETQTQKLIKN